MKQDDLIKNFLSVLQQIDDMEGKKTDLSRQLVDLGLFTALKSLTLLTSRAVLADTVAKEEPVVELTEEVTESFTDKVAKKFKKGK